MSRYEGLLDLFGDTNRLELKEQRGAPATKAIELKENRTSISYRRQFAFC